jgi:hypothetical protein
MMPAKSFSALDAHLCGYAPRHRWDKPLAFLQAYIDESQAESGDQRLFFAGYLNRARAWGLFSEAWDEELRRKPSIEYLKMSEARALRGQFLGWKPEDRNEKINDLARLVAHFKPISFEFSISKVSYVQYMYGDVPYGVLEPKLLSAFAVISILTDAMSQDGSDMQIDFIFDEMQGVDFDTLVLFDALKNNLPYRQRKLISSPPIFRNDVQFKPIQAADMLAWHLRRQQEKADIDNEIMKKLTPNVHVTSGMPAGMGMKLANELQNVHGVEALKSKKDWKNALKTISSLDRVKRTHPIRHIIFSIYLTTVYRIDALMAKIRK